MYNEENEDSFGEQWKPINMISEKKMIVDKVGLCDSAAYLNQEEIYDIGVIRSLRNFN